MMNREHRRGRVHERIKRQNPRQVQLDGIRRAPLECASWTDNLWDVAANSRAIVMFVFKKKHALTGGCLWQVNKYKVRYLLQKVGKVFISLRHSRRHET